MQRATASAMGPSSPGSSAGVGSSRAWPPGATLLDVQVADEEGNTSLSKVSPVWSRCDARRRRTSSTSACRPIARFPRRSIPWLGRWSGSGPRESRWSRPLGTTGPAEGSVSSPGNDPVLLTVGALDEGATADATDDAVADFSSRGHRVLRGEARSRRARSLPGLHHCSRQQRGRARTPHVARRRTATCAGPAPRCRRPWCPARRPQSWEPSPSSARTGQGLLTGRHTAYSKMPRARARAPLTSGPPLRQPPGRRDRGKPTGSGDRRVGAQRG